MLKSSSEVSTVNLPGLSAISAPRLITDQQSEKREKHEFTGRAEEYVITLLWLESIFRVPIITMSC